GLRSNRDNRIEYAARHCGAVAVTDHRWTCRENRLGTSAQLAPGCARGGATTGERDALCCAPSHRCACVLEHRASSACGNRGARTLVDRCVWFRITACCRVVSRASASL